MNAFDDKEAYIEKYVNERNEKETKGTVSDERELGEESGENADETGIRDLLKKLLGEWCTKTHSQKEQSNSRSDELQRLHVIYLHRDQNGSYSLSKDKKGANCWAYILTDLGKDPND